MTAERMIQAAVARADLIVCAALRALAMILPLCAVLLVAVLIVRARWPDPCRIDYDRPGVDITSEGPEDDWTQAWHEAGGDGD